MNALFLGWPLKRPTMALATFALLMAGLAGCGGSAGMERYVPSVESGRSALEAALAAWQEEIPPGRIDSVRPVVMLVDTQRRKGQSLSKFQIQGETAGDGPRCFSVQATLKNPDEEQILRFVVVGIDPLWVFRYEDYELMAHWDHPMEDH